jgi:hypothetical protein
VIDFGQHMEGWLCTSINVIRQLLWVVRIFNLCFCCCALRACLFLWALSTTPADSMLVKFRRFCPVCLFFLDHLIMLGDFYLDILINPGQSLTGSYSENLDSFSMSPFPVPPVITRPASGTCLCLDHALTKFPDVFGDRFSCAISDHCFLSFLIVINHHRR